MGDMILMLEMTTSGPGQAVNKSLGKRVSLCTGESLINVCLVA